LRAPASESSPPTTQTANTASTVPTFWIIVRGTRKIPLPITVPTTMDAAAHGPRARFNSVRGAFSIGELFLGVGVTGRQMRQTADRFAYAGCLQRRRQRSLEERGQQADPERGDRPDQHVPGPGDRCVEVYADPHGEARGPPGDGGIHFYTPVAWTWYVLI